MIHLKLSSTLDSNDGFMHFSDNTSTSIVVRLFYTTATDLGLLHLDTEKFAVPVI